MMGDMIRIADAHSDFTAMNVIKEDKGRLFDHADIDRWEKGGVKLQVFAVWVPPEHPQKRQCAMEQIEYLFSCLHESNGRLILCESIEELSMDVPIKAVLAIEGGESIECRTDLIQYMYDSGARILSLTWNDENSFASGCNAQGGLKDEGIKAIREMNRLRMALDLSHINEQGFWEAVETYAGSPCATHSCVYDIKVSARNLKKDQIRCLIDRDGYIGINFYTEFLIGRTADIDDILDHIEYVLMCGGNNAVGFGSDFCGIQYTPEGLDSVADFQKLPDLMARRGYSDSLINKICYGNFKEYILKFF